MKTLEEVKIMRNREVGNGGENFVILLLGKLDHFIITKIFVRIWKTKLLLKTRNGISFVGI